MENNFFSIIDNVEFLRVKRELQYLQERNVQSSFIFPFEIFNFGTNDTNFGEITNIGGINSDSFNYFAKIFNGVNPICAVWKNSTDGSGFPNNDPQNEFPVRKFQIGNYFKGVLIDNAESVLFDNYKDKKIQYIHKIYNFYVTDKFFEDDNDKTNLYTIEIDSTKQWFYISEIKVYRNLQDSEQIYNVTFETLNNLLQNTGLSTRQYINYGSIGEGYAFPKVENGEVKLDSELIKDIGVDTIQIHFLNASIPISLIPIGRNIRSDDIIENPRILLNYKLEPLIVSNIEIYQSPTTQYYALLNSIVTIEGFYTNWTDFVSKYFNPVSTRNYYGYIKTNSELVKNTNNPDNTINAGEYLNYNELKMAFNSDNISLNSVANPYVKSDNFVFPEIVRLAPYINHFGINLLDTFNLPMELKYSTSVSIKDIPIVGFFIPAKLGASFGWMMSSEKIKGKYIGGIIDVQLYNYLIANEYVSFEGALPVNVFQDDRSEVGTVLGTKTITSGLRISLTDRYATYDNSTGTYSGDVYNTENLGTEGVVWAPQYHGYPRSDTQYYIIDALIFDCVAFGEAIITAYRNNNPIFQTQILTKQAYNNSLRPFKNVLKFSHWGQNYVGEKKSYPNDIIIPEPSTDRIYNIDYSITKLNDGIEWIREFGNLINEETGDYDLREEITFPDFILGEIDILTKFASLEEFQTYDNLIISEIQLLSNFLERDESVKFVNNLTLNVKELINNGFINHTIANYYDSYVPTYLIDSEESGASRFGISYDFRWDYRPSSMGESYKGIQYLYISKFYRTQEFILKLILDGTRIRFSVDLKYSSLEPRINEKIQGAEFDGDGINDPGYGSDPVELWLNYKYFGMNKQKNPAVRVAKIKYIDYQNSRVDGTFHNVAAHASIFKIKNINFTQNEVANKIVQVEVNKVKVDINDKKEIKINDIINKWKEKK
jgi:hypothetical protein